MGGIRDLLKTKKKVGLDLLTNRKTMRSRGQSHPPLPLLLE